MQRVLFDATRLAWRARRGSPTGIDRVTQAYARWLTSRDDVDLTPVALAGDGFGRVPKARFERLLRGVAKEAQSPNWAALVKALEAPAGRPALRLGVAAASGADVIGLASEIAARRVSHLATAPPQGDVYINVAHTGLDRPGLLAGVRRRGVAVVVMVHDLIPLTHPEYCAPSAETKHRRRMQNVAEQADLVITNSKATAQAFEDFCAEIGQPAPDIVVAPLGLEPAFLAGVRPLRTDRPYFVAVGTIEARKNLSFILALWSRIAEGLREDAPQLVLVGRRGWENEAVIDQLERAPAIRRLVHEVADLTDPELASLLSGAAGLLAPSLAEGYDLPAVEALAVGAPVVASDIPAHREVACGAVLVDPLDGPGWRRAIEAAMTARTPPGGFTPPTWEGHFACVGDAIGRILRR